MTILLHGFWGGPADWRDVLAKLPLGENALAPDLYEAGSLASNHPLNQWTENFLKWVDRNCGAEPVQLVGYSMGARLALSALVAKPERFSRALLLSGLPVLEKGAHAERLTWEEQWAAKFLNQPWAELASSWQEQGVFAGSRPQPRRQGEELREWLAASLLNWSPRQHSFDWSDVAAVKADFAYGALDQKYLKVAKTLQDLQVKGQIATIPNAGHRLITDAADFIAHWITGR